MEPHRPDTPYVRLKVSLLQPKDPLGRAHVLWLADDHLLCVCTGYFRQTASRIDYCDIEAIVHRPTALFAWTNALALVPCLVGTGLIALASPPWAIFGICLLLPCLVVLLVNLLLGRTCECRLQTRVGTRTLYALNRERYVRRALPMLVPRIEAAQAGLAPVSAGLAQTPLEAAVTPLGTPLTEVRPARHPLHALCFAALAIQALLFVLAVRFTSVPLLLATVAGAALLVAVALLTAGVQHRRPVATRLRVVTWVVAASTLLGWTVAYAVFWFAIFQKGLVEDGLSMENQLDRLLLRYVRALAQDGLPDWLATGLLGLAVLAALLAVVGFGVFMTVPPLASPARPTGAATEGR